MDVIAMYLGGPDTRPTVPFGRGLPYMAYNEPRVNRAVEIIRLPISRGFRRPTLSTKSWAGMVKTKFIIPEIPEARKLPCRDGKPACEKMIGAK
jgi:hypothetical protein